MFPWIQFLKTGGKRLSDIEFMAIKEFDGKAVDAEGSGTSTGAIVTLTASSGKDLYLAKAKVSAHGTNSGVGVDSGRIALKQNGTIVGEWTFVYSTNGGASTNPSTGVPADNYEFPLTGIKVAATQTFTLDITAVSGNVTFEGQLTGFQEDTGDSPQV